MASSISQPPVIGIGNLKVKIIGSLGIFKEVKCNVFYKRSLSNILWEYTKLNGADYNNVKFTFNGIKIKQNNTPKTLKMQIGDVIQASKSNNMKIKVVRYSDSSEISLHVDPLTPLHKVRKQYCSKVDLKAAMMVHKDNVLTNNETPMSLKMEENDVIVFYSEEDTVNIKICNQHDILNGITFTMKYGESFANTMKEYVERVGTNLQVVKFYYKNAKVHYRSTPAQLNITGDVTFEVKKTKTIVKFVGPDHFSKVVNVGLKVQPMLKEAIKKYAMFVGKEIGELKYTFNGERIKRNNTTEKLKMKDNDIIEVQIEKFESIIIKVVPPTWFEMSYRIKYNTPMSKLKNNYAMQVGINAKTLWFLYYGKRVNDNDTPQTMEMDENDRIEVYESSYPFETLL